MRLRTFPVGALAVLAVVALVLTGCSGDNGRNGKDGAPGTPGTPGASTGTLSGTVTNKTTGQPIAGATLTLTPAVAGVTLVSAANGTYSAVLPIGVYSIAVAATNYTTSTVSQSVLAAGNHVLNVALAPTGAVLVKILGLPTSSGPGTVMNLTAQVTILDGSTLTGYEWSQTNSVAASIVPTNAAAATVTLGSTAAYKAELLEIREPLSRWEVLGFDPLTLEETGHVGLELTVTTSSGTYSASADINSTMPFAAWALGINNVPINVPCMLNSAEQASYDWVLQTKPVNSSAVLNDAATKNPWFVPDAPGAYGFVCWDIAGQKPVTLTVYAGTWDGIIVGQDGDGNPLVDPMCLACHGEGFEPTKAKLAFLTNGNGNGEEDNPFYTWPASGHAHIFTDNLNTSTHYGPDCFPCHTVGYSTAAVNAGIDEAGDYQAFLGSGMLNHPGNNWATMLASYPASAAMGNIQCENCHGPQNSAGHTTSGLGDPALVGSRISLKADVCGYCHGEPPRHARYQQWAESGHGNYELAIDEGMSTSCARCHSAQGFLAWLPRLEAGNNGSLSSGDITWDANSVHPLTCVVCHDPHDVGTTSGNAGDAKMRVTGSTSYLPSGYTAYDVGNGAMCITCHNTRNGQRDDEWYQDNPDKDDRAPHVAAQGDVLLGFNAFFVDRESRGAHSFLEDTCVTCHLELTPPPAELSYQLGGTNHTFEATLEICGDCHGEYDGGTLMDNVERKLEDFKAAIDNSLVNIVYEAVYNWGDTLEIDAVVVNPDGSETTTTYQFDWNDSIWYVEFQAEFHGRMSMLINVNGTLYENIQLAKAHFINQGTDVLHTLWGQWLARAAWNFHLLEGDGSEGVHNPGFYFDVIRNSIDAVENAMEDYYGNYDK